LIFAVTFAFAAAIEPGPLQAYLVSRSLALGWRNTILASFAPLLSDAPIITLTVLVLSRMPPFLVQSLQIIGGIYLLYLAIEAFKTYRNYSAEKVLQTTGSNTLFKAVLVNLLNPNPYLGWSLVMGPLLLKVWREAPVNGVLLLIGFYATMVLSLLGTIMLFSAFRNLGARINHALIGISGIALGGFGLYELWLSVRTFV